VADFGYFGNGCSETDTAGDLPALWLFQQEAAVAASLLGAGF
jgi:hypothetical protein